MFFFYSMFEILRMCVFVKAMGVTIEAIFVFYSFVGGIIFIVMSTLAGAALRSTKSQVKKTRLYTTDTAENCAFHNIC